LERAGNPYQWVAFPCPSCRRAFSTTPRNSGLLGCASFPNPLLNTAGSL
jgi:hypothetical protein